MPPLTQNERKELNRRGQALFIATGQFVSVLKYVGVGLGVVGLIAVLTALLKGIMELAFLGVLTAGVGVTLFFATNYVATLAEIAVTLLKLQLDAAGEAPSGDQPVTLAKPSPAAPSAPAAKPGAPTPPASARKPAQDLPPIPLAGDEEKPS